VWIYSTFALKYFVASARVWNRSTAGIQLQLLRNYLFHVVARTDINDNVLRVTQLARDVEGVGQRNQDCRT
jgi:hypothetical protein